EVRQWRRLVGAEAVEIVLQLFAVQRVERQQLLDRIDQRHAVGLYLVARILVALGIVHFHQIRRLASQPAADTHAGHALGHELQLAALARGVMYAHHGAVFWQAVGVEAGRVLRRVFHVEQRQTLVWRLANQLQRLRPRLFIDDDRQYLGREERPVVDRNDVELIWQVLVR